MKEKFKNKIDKISQYLNDHGSFPSQKSENPEDRKLYYMIKDLSKKKRENLLTNEELQYIMDNIPELFENRRERRVSFEDHLAYINNYKEENGVFPSAEHCDEKYGNVGAWMSMQRALYKKGELSKDREDALNAIGFVWNPLGGATFREIWISRFEEIKQKHDKTGEWPRCSDKRGYRWLSQQSWLYRNGKLEKWKVEKMKEAGLDIATYGKVKRSHKKHEEKWFLQIEPILVFYNQNNRLPEKGELDLPCGEDAHAWLSVKIKNLSKGNNEFKKEICEKLGFDLRYDNCIDDRMFRHQAIQYKNSYMNTPLQLLPEDLQKWKKNVISAIKRGTLKKNRKKLLEDLGLIESLYKK